MFEGLFIGLVAGAAAVAILMMWWKGRRRASEPAGPTINVQSSVESLRSVGELVVLKVFTQQIVTKSEHLFGDWGEKWLAWLVSSKKTAMIFDFVVDFRYDLKSGKFVPRIYGESGVEFNMPPCFYEIQLKDIKIYDERASVAVPLILPEWLGQIFGGKFSEKEKNQLIDAARTEAERLARQLAGRMIGEVQHSAEATLRQIARAMGFTESRFKFNEQTLVQGEVDMSDIEEAASEAVADARR